MVCTDEGGTWAAEKPAECNLGCCILGDQASFVPLVRCKRLSSFYSLETNWNSGIQNEALCVLTARAEENGACVFREDFETTCKMTKRSECVADRMLGGGIVDDQEEPEEEESEEEESSEEENEEGDEGGDVLESPEEGDVEFHAGKLCTAPELGSICGPSEDTTCLPGREEVYFLDTCGNPANIYDGGKVRNVGDYWTDILDKSESCHPDQANEFSQTCGNCNYLLGSYCGVDKSGKVTYGDNICISLNCESSEETGGQDRLHGESWCGFDEDRDFTYQAVEQNAFTDMFDELFKEALGNVQGGGMPDIGFFSAGNVPVGSKFYRYLCSHGEVLVEPCADFRQEECIENNVAGYSEAACRVNRWQDCTSIFKEIDCVNTDKRDCAWLPGMEYVLMGGAFSEGEEGGAGGTTVDQASMGNLGEQLKKFNSGERELGACIPKIPPGLKFWGETDEEGETQNDEAQTVCSQANAVCPVTYEKKLVGGSWECIENCQCIEEETHLKRAQLCMALGDCGPKTNIKGQMGRGKGYKIFEEDVDD